MSTVLVQVRRYGDAYLARIGSGKLTTTASSTSSAESAARVAAAKLFGLPPYSNEADSIALSLPTPSAASGRQLFRAEFSGTSSASVPSVVKSAAERSAA